LRIEGPYPKELINREIYPKFYYCKRGVSDRDWMLSRMSVIPKDRKKEVSDRYTKLFLSGKSSARKDANTYLHNEAVKFREQINGR
jgi:hypothetical protein